MITTIDFIIIGGILLVVFICLAIMFVRWKIWAKKQDCRWNKLSDWLNDHILCGITCSTIALITSICFIGCSIDCVSKINNNRINEGARYEQAIIEAVTITDALEVSEDIVNTDLYVNAVDYNANLAEMKAMYNNPHYKVNFTGRYDWNVLEYISLKQEDKSWD